MNSDFLQRTIEKIPLPQEANKLQTFSTSTPLLPVFNKEKQLPGLSLSIASSTYNDSGLGVSLKDISVTSPLDAGQPTVTLTAFTPKTNRNTPHLYGRNCFLTESPVSSRKLKPRRNLGASFDAYDTSDNQSSGFCSLDDASFENHEHTSETSPKNNKSFVRKLNLDINISDSEDKLSSVSKDPTVTSISKRLSLDAQFNDVLSKCSPLEPDRLIGKKMGLEHVDIVSQLHNRSILSLVLKYLEPEDLCG